MEYQTRNSCSNIFLLVSDLWDIWFYFLFYLFSFADNFFYDMIATPLVFFIYFISLSFVMQLEYKEWMAGGWQVDGRRMAGGGGRMAVRWAEEEEETVRREERKEGRKRWRWHGNITLNITQHITNASHSQQEAPSSCNTWRPGSVVFTKQRSSN